MKKCPFNIESNTKDVIVDALIYSSIIYLIQQPDFYTKGFNNVEMKTFMFFIAYLTIQKFTKRL
jgi:hypothetical protein